MVRYPLPLTPLRVPMSKEDARAARPLTPRVPGSFAHPEAVVRVGASRGIIRVPLKAPLNHRDFLKGYRV